MDLVVFLVGGLLGSSHCVGMCGGFALSLGTAAPRLSANLARQALYTLGRIFTYAFGGATAAYAGLRLEHALPSLAPAQAALALVAGVLLIGQGLAATGLYRPSWRAGRLGCLLPPLLRSLLAGRSAVSLLLAGVFTGFLPCGLVYAFLALAAARGDVAAGALAMALFGVGTAPIMMAVGLGGSVLSLAARRNVLRLAGYCVLLAGVASAYRGVGFLTTSSSTAATDAQPVAPSCPFCAANHDR